MSSSCRRLLQRFLLLSGAGSDAAFMATHSFCIRHHDRTATNSIHRRNVHLPKQRDWATVNELSSSLSDDEEHQTSVTGTIYETNIKDNGISSLPQIKLFTKQGCTLCDKVKDTLSSLRVDYPHSLYAVDITDIDKLDWYNKYKFDIPVLHMNNVYWTKHRLTTEDAIEAIVEATRCGDLFEERKGEPDAGRLEH
jgi:glutaredoxin